MSGIIDRLATWACPASVVELAMDPKPVRDFRAWLTDLELVIPRRWVAIEDDYRLLTEAEVDALTDEEADDLFLVECDMPTPDTIAWAAYTCRLEDKFPGPFSWRRWALTRLILRNFPWVRYSGMWAGADPYGTHIVTSVKWGRR